MERVMVSAPPEKVTLSRLHSLGLRNLVEIGDEDGREAVTDFLEGAVDVVAQFLALHGKEIDPLPTVAYDQFESGVTYDPLHADGERLVCGGPRGLLRGGENTLVSRTGLDRPSLLMILCRGLLVSYDYHLAGGTRAADVDPTPFDIELYDRYGLATPAVDYAFTTLFDVYLAGDVTDRSLRESVIGAWTDWCDGTGAVDARTYESVARTVSERIEAADGTPRERLCHGLAVQEPLVREGRTTVLNLDA